MKAKRKKRRSINDYGALYQALQVEAVFNALTNNAAFFERKVRRWFSKNYNTPLQDTYNLNWSDILIHYYESALEDKDKNQIFDLAMDNYLPEFMNRKEEEDAAFAQSLLEEQKRTLVKKQGAGKDTKKGNKKAPNTGQSRKPEEKKEVMSLKFDDEQFKEDIEE